MPPHKKAKRRNSASLYLFAALMVFLLAAAGCGTRLRYSFPSNTKIVYHVTTHTETNVSSPNTTIPGMVNDREYFLTVEPLSSERGGTRVKGGLGAQNLPRDIESPQLFTETFLVMPDGRIADIRGNLGRMEDWKDLFFEIPDRRLRKGETWLVKRRIDVFQQTPVISLQYTLEGFEKKQRRKCARIRVSGRFDHTEQMPLSQTGEIASATGHYELAGVIFFSPRRGLPVEVDYTRTFISRMEAIQMGAVLGQKTITRRVRMSLKP